MGDHKPGKSIPDGRCIRFRRGLVNRISRLLHMRYTIREIADELQVEPRQIRRYLSNGAPCEVDDKGHVWVIGTQFRDWVNDVRESRKNPLGPGQAYCLRCNAVATMIGPLSTVRVRKTRFQVLMGKCAVCGAKVTRGQSRRRKRD